MVGNLIKIVIGIFIIHFLWTKIFFPPRWLGFYYPDAGDLTQSLKSPQEYKTLEECRVWVKNMTQGRTDNNWDYECGSNCKIDKDYSDLSKNSPEMIKKYNLTPSYICNETLN